MTNPAFLERTSLPRPDMSEKDAAAILKSHYGLEGPIRELGSQQDRNYRIEANGKRYVLKLCWSAYDRIELDVQNAAMRHASGKASAPLVPLAHPNRDGRDLFTIDLNGQSLHVRLVDYLDGTPLSVDAYLPRPTVVSLGDCAGRLAAALADFAHPGLARDVQWDLRKAESVIARQVADIADRAVADRILALAHRARLTLEPLHDDLRLQAVHHDVTCDNVVSSKDHAGNPIVTGIIDFGDITSGWLAADLASTVAGLIPHVEDDPFRILPAIAAYHAACPLTDAEITALWPLVVLRAAGLAAADEQQLAVDPGNDYVIGNIARDWQIFEAVDGLPFALMENAIRQTLGSAPASAKLPPHRPICAFTGLETLDLTSTSPAFAFGNWQQPDAVDAMLAEAASRSGAAATRFGEYRLTEAKVRAPHGSESLALFTTLALPADSSIVAPFEGRFQAHDGGHELTGSGVTLRFEGLIATPADGPVQEGVALGRATRLTLQLRDARLDRAPRFAHPRRADAWTSLVLDPSPLLGFDVAAPRPDPDMLLKRRKAHFARPQKNYYAAPPQIERGYREHMYDVQGQSFLDMVNNVSICGHGHRHLSEAVGRQWSMLNTNSRFHYAAVTEFSERLAALAPDGLDTVFLVNSGSEANDLVMRLAWAHTGAKNMLCLLEAYHGWSVASDAVSTSIADNPNALTTRPDWVHPVMSPNTYRGPYRGDGSAAAYAAHARQALEKIDAKGERLAGFIAESVYGNAGGVTLPPGYLKTVYAMVKERGGVTIADEVQVGYGRLGHHFWGFDEQGVVPDIITIAKGMGNGHPLGAVITTRAIADSLEKEGYFFSSAGGSPVSCIVGMTVLDIMEREGLVENARRVGDHLKHRLEALGQRFDLVGAVHGMGLYLGLEFVTDREKLTPATSQTTRICERLMELGVIMQPTGDYLNVLKIKPPMCLSIESADYFADMLARVLDEGV